MVVELTKVEVKLLNGLSKKERRFFDEHFGKISPRRWTTDLKHYGETYSIQDALVICKAYF